MVHIHVVSQWMRRDRPGDRSRDRSTDRPGECQRACRQWRGARGAVWRLHWRSAHSQSSPRDAIYVEGGHGRTLHSGWQFGNFGPPTRTGRTPPRSASTSTLRLLGSYVRLSPWACSWFQLPCIPPVAQPASKKATQQVWPRRPAGLADRDPALRASSTIALAAAACSLGVAGSVLAADRSRR
jgi:hypothetical protein